MAKLSDDRFSEWFERLWDAVGVSRPDPDDPVGDVVLDEEDCRSVLSEVESHGFQRAIRALRERAKRGPRSTGKHFDWAADHLEQLEKSDG